MHKSHWCLRQGLDAQHRLALNLGCYCLSFWRAVITGMYYHAQEGKDQNKFTETTMGKNEDDQFLEKGIYMLTT